MKEAIKTFHKGMNTDLDYSLIEQGSYLYAKNFRVGNKNSSYNSLGSLENVEGNLEVMDLNSATCLNADISETYTNFEIFKVISIRETFVFFVTCDVESSGSIIASNISMILKAVPSGIYVPEYAVVFSSDTDMNFSTEMSAVGRYESEKIQKVYWTTGEDPLRVINIEDSYDLVGVSFKLVGGFPGYLDHVPDVEFQNISIDEILSGGSYKTGVVQYAYQLYNNNSSISTISPVTSPVLLSSTSTNDIGGSDIGEDSNKSVQISINNLDSRFERVRILSLFHDKLYSNPTVNIVAEQKNIGSITFTDVGNPIGEMSYEEFLVFNQTTYSPKSIEFKDDILFSANIKESTFNSDVLENPDNPDYWDSRAYPFPVNSDTTLVYNGTSQSNYTLGELDTVPFDSDALTKNKDFTTSNQKLVDISSHPLYYRFKPNSDTLGGEGPNVEFTYGVVTDNIDKSENERGYNLDISESQDIRGLQPGDVYRFGIVFYNKKGQTSFVKWVQDIRIPYTELIGSNDNVVYTDAFPGDIAARNVYIRFSLKNPPNDPNIEGWQVVRVKRSFKDREMLYNGILLPTSPATYGGDTEDFCRPLSRRFSTTSNYHLGIPLNTEESFTDNKLSEFISPDLLFSNSMYIPEESVCVVNRYYSYYSNYTKGDGSHVYLDAKAYNISPWPEGRTFPPIDRSEKMGTSFYRDNAVTSLSTSSPDNPNAKFRNVTKTGTYSTSYTNIGISGTKYVLATDFPTIPSVWDVASNRRAANADILQDVSETRYGGVSYQARKLNYYIPYGGINKITTSQDGTVSKDFNGDTYLKMFTYLRNAFQYEYIVSEWGDDRAMQEIVTFPVYSSVNLNYRNDNILKYLFKGSDLQVEEDGVPAAMMVQEEVQTGIQFQPSLYNEDIGDLYTYNSVYSKQNEAKQFYPMPFDFTDSHTIDTKVIASEKKIDGENIDSWTRFKTSNFIEVNSKYGPINILKNFKNSLFYFQDKAFGVLAVNDRSLIQDNNLGQLALGTGGVLTRYDYVDTNIGCVSERSLDSADSALYWYDELNNQLLEYSKRLTYLDLEKGVQSFIRILINRDAEVTVDSDYREVYFSFKNSDTLVYSQYLGGFTGEYSFRPYTTFKDFKNRVHSISLADKGKAYMHNEGYRGDFYGTKSNSLIRLLVNEDYSYIKVFDNLEFPSKSFETESFQDTFDYITVYNDYQNSGEYQLVKDGEYTETSLPLKRRERMWNTFIPRNAVNTDISNNPDITDSSNIDKSRKFKERMRDKHLILELEYDNSEGKRFYTPYVKITYRPSIR